MSVWSASQIETLIGTLSGICRLLLCACISKTLINCCQHDTNYGAGITTVELPPLSVTVGKLQNIVLIDESCGKVCPSLGDNIPTKVDLSCVQRVVEQIRWNEPVRNILSCFLLQLFPYVSALNSITVRLGLYSCEMLALCFFPFPSYFWLRCLSFPWKNKLTHPITHLKIHR